VELEQMATVLLLQHLVTLPLISMMSCNQI